MILDRLENAGRYRGLHAGLAAAFDYIASGKLAELPVGKHEIDGKRLFVMVADERGRGEGVPKLEAHKRYIDIQMVTTGQDRIGWKPTKLCQPDAEGFHEDKDIGFFGDEPENWLVLHPGDFTVFFPEDAHAPLSTEGTMHKAVFKIALDW